jgi:S-adenosylmethionine:diacylglycerol 3-amino-3-carboxypropyl transferase
VSEPLRRRPLYSLDNEDTRSELRALEIGPGDSVVAVCAGGGRALSLLAAGPRSLVAVDRRRDQLYGLELKAAALGCLGHPDLLAFLGVLPGCDRLDQYAMLRGSLGAGARRYWDERASLVEGGALFAGRLERALLAAAAALRRLGGLRWSAPLFAMESVEAQRALLGMQRTRVARGLLPWRILLHPAVVYAAAQDPGFLRSTEGGVGSYVVARFERWLEANLARESFLLHLLFHGRLHAWGPLPPYLEPEGAARARKHLDRLEIRCADLRELELPAGERVRWSLSDVSCWMSEREFHALLRRIVRGGAPGSRLCARNFAARRRLPPDLRARVRRLDALCAELDAHDGSILYTFEAAEWG